MGKLRNWLQALLVVAVLALGFGLFAYLRATKPVAAREERTSEGLLVEVREVHEARHEVSVRANGTVLPALRVVVQPEASGRIVWQNPALVPGGRIAQGAPLVRIDRRDYELELRARRSEVSRTGLELRLERSRQEVARREWDLFGEMADTAGTRETPAAPEPAGGGQASGAEGDAESGVLALREPQVRSAEVAVQSAKSALERAKLDLERTVVRAPFNAQVLQEQTDVGQLVSPQTQLATLVGTDSYWVQVAVPLEELAHIAIPGSGRAAPDAGAARARVYQKVGGAQVAREGRVIRLLPDLDSGGAMARLLVAIEDPLGLESGAGELPLLLNSYVHVEIEATPIERAIEVPRLALRDGDRVFVVDDQQRLRVRDVQIAWRRTDSVLVRAGLADGDRVVTSRVAAPVDGMPVRTAERGQGSPRVAADRGAAGDDSPAPNSDAKPREETL